MAKLNKPAATAAEPRPYLKSVHLRDVPPLRDVKASFKPGLNIIIGPNGAGKTQFMKLVSELVELYEEKHRGVNSSFTLGGIKPALTVTVQTPPQVKDKSFVRYPIRTSPLIVVVADKDVEAQGNTVWGGATVLLRGYMSYEVISVWHGLPNRRMLIVDEGLDLTFDNSGGMRTPNAPSDWQESSLLVRAFMDNLVPYDVGSPSNNFAQHPIDEIRGFIKRGIGVHLDRLNDNLPHYSPMQGVRLGEQFQVYHNTSQEEVIVKGLSLEYLIGGDWLPFSVLSDGTKRIFYLMGELLTASFAHMNKTHTDFELSDRAKIILLEEPELGIHPKQLQKLLQFIREVSKQNQVILTTHSPQTLDMLTAQELDRITICDYVPGKGTQMRKLSAEKKKKARAYLKDQGFLSEFWRFSNLESPD